MQKRRGRRSPSGRRLPFFTHGLLTSLYINQAVVVFNPSLGPFTIPHSLLSFKRVHHSRGLNPVYQTPPPLSALYPFTWVTHLLIISHSILFVKQLLHFCGLYSICQCPPPLSVVYPSSSLSRGWRNKWRCSVLIVNSHHRHYHGDQPDLHRKYDES